MTRLKSRGLMRVVSLARDAGRRIALRDELARRVTVARFGTGAKPVDVAAEATSSASNEGDSEPNET
jgi:hypothetical protein